MKSAHTPSFPECEGFLLICMVRFKYTECYSIIIAFAGAAASLRNTQLFPLSSDADTDNPFFSLTHSTQLALFLSPSSSDPRHGYMFEKQIMFHEK
jgi:hypothetical protein